MLPVSSHRTLTKHVQRFTFNEINNFYCFIKETPKGLFLTLQVDGSEQSMIRVPHGTTAFISAKRPAVLFITAFQMVRKAKTVLASS